MRISQVKETTKNIKGATSEIVHEVDILQTHVRTQDENIRTLMAKIKKNTENMWNLEETRTTAEFGRLMHSIRSIIEKLLQHRLSHEMLDST